MSEIRTYEEAVRRLHAIIKSGDDHHSYAPDILAVLEREHEDAERYRRRVDELETFINGVAHNCAQAARKGVSDE